nr:MAG TPA: hypothetical protein [Caudoviricetes sp.]
MSCVLLSAAPGSLYRAGDNSIRAAGRRTLPLWWLVAWHTGDCVHTDQEGGDGHDQTDWRIAVFVRREHPVKQLAHRSAPSLH